MANSNEQSKGWWGPIILLTLAVIVAFGIVIFVGSPTGAKHLRLLNSDDGPSIKKSQYKLGTEEQDGKKNESVKLQTLQPKSVKTITIRPESLMPQNDTSYALNSNPIDLM